MPEEVAVDNGSSRRIKLWIAAVLGGAVFLSALTAFLALQAEDSVKKSFEGNVTAVLGLYGKFTEANGKPPASKDEFLNWLGQAGEPGDITKWVETDRVVVQWGATPAPAGSGSEQVLAYTNDPPVRGRRPAGMLDGTVRWLTPEEFEAAPKAEPIR